MSNNREWVVLVVVQPMWKFYIDYLIIITDPDWMLSRQDILQQVLNN